VLLNIRSKEANQLAAEVAILTGETKTDAVIQALKGSASIAFGSKGRRRPNSRTAGSSVSIGLPCAVRHGRFLMSAALRRSADTTSTGCPADGDRFLRYSRHSSGRT